jgi:hypothetical protein
VIIAIVSAVLLVAMCVLFRDDVKQAAKAVSADQEPQPAPKDQEQPPQPSTE